MSLNLKNRIPWPSDVILDATARLLAPRHAARPAGGTPAATPADKPAKAPPQPLQGLQARRAPVAGAQAGRGRAAVRQGLRQKEAPSGPRNGPPELRRGTQKDSTEQPGSLMKPYYMNYED